MGKQKRSENTYQKINTIFFRDTNNIIMPYAGYVDPTLEYLENVKFECTEKIDGTNMRIEVDLIPCSDVENHLLSVDCEYAVKGKTDNAEVPKHLMKHILEKYPKEKVFEALGLKERMEGEDLVAKKWETLYDVPQKYTIYGEGYGAKIQKSGGNYLSKSCEMIGFDVKVLSGGKEIWLNKESCQDIFEKLGMEIVPFIGMFTIKEAIEFVKKGFKSKIAENNDFLAEGLVCKTPIGLLDRRGRRVIFKVKTGDWNKYYNKYGTYDPVEQTKNPLAYGD